MTKEYEFLNEEGIDRSVGNAITVDLEMKKVKEVCELAGVTRKTLYYYDKIGLLKPTARIGTQKHKVYSDEAVRKLLMIRIYHKAGFNITEIKELLSGNDSKKQLQKLLHRQQNALNHLQSQISFTKSINMYKLQNYSLEELQELLGR